MFIAVYFPFSSEFQLVNEKPVSKFYRQYDKSRPTVTGIKEFKNGSKKVDSGLSQITIKFADKMDKRYRNFELGPLGETHILKIKEFKDAIEETDIVLGAVYEGLFKEVIDNVKLFGGIKKDESVIKIISMIR